MHIPGACYHVIGRGLERRHIFRGAADKRDFLSRLGRCLSRSQAQCLAWAIMPNHYHLLIRAGIAPLSKLMGPILGGYGGSYNRRHQRAGYVFQNRFKSILCEEEAYLLELVRYIHLNPLRAGVVRDLGELDLYPWTGHAGILTKKARQSWYPLGEVLSLFGDSRSKALSGYRRFIKDGVGVQKRGAYSRGGLIRSYGGWEAIAQLKSEHSRCIGDERILGSSQFVEEALAEDELRIEKKTLRARQGWTLNRLIDRSCKYYAISPRRLGSRARQNKLALVKSLICYWGAEEIGLSQAKIGKHLRISQQSVSKWVRQGQEYCGSGNLSLDDLPA